MEHISIYAVPKWAHIYKKLFQLIVYTYLSKTLAFGSMDVKRNVESFYWYTYHIYLYIRAVFWEPYCVSRLNVKALKNNGLPSLVRSYDKKYKTYFVSIVWYFQGDNLLTII